MGEQQKAQATADYDISQAYAAYKKQTMQAMNTASMAEGTKERLAEEGRKQYESTALQINEGLEESRADITTQYSKLLNNWQSNLEKQADMSAQLEEAFMNYADAWGYTEYSEEDTNQGRGDWFSKYYAPGQEQNRKEILERVMYGGQDTGNSLSNTLAQENPKLYDFYISNQDYFNKMLLGIDEPGYRGEGYNWENRQSEKDRLTIVKENADKRGISVEGEFKTATEELNAYKEQYKQVITKEIEKELDNALKSGGVNYNRDALTKKLDPLLNESLLNMNDIDVDKFITKYLSDLPKKGTESVIKKIDDAFKSVGDWIAGLFR